MVPLAKFPFREIPPSRSDILCKKNEIAPPLRELGRFLVPSVSI